MSRTATVLALALLASASALRLQDKIEVVQASPARCGDGKQPELPAELKSLGVELFGSEANLAKVVNATGSVCNVKRCGFDMKFLAAAADNQYDLLVLESQGKWEPALEHGGCLTDAEYGMSRLKPDSTGVMVDIGANTGDTAVPAAMMRPKMQIIAFEPVPETFFYMRWNMHLNGVEALSEADLGQTSKPGVLAMQSVVGNGKDIELSYNPENSWGNGPEGVKKYVRGEYRTIKVHSVKLPELMKSHSVATIELLKVDCEGCEFFLIPQLRELIADKKKVQRVAFEVHMLYAPSKDILEETRTIVHGRGCDWQASSKLWEETRTAHGPEKMNPIFQC